MSEKLTHVRHVASGAHLFARYALTCCENGCDGNGSRSEQDVCRLRLFVNRNDSNEQILLQTLLSLMFPGPVREFCEVLNENPTNVIWPIERVQIHWRYTHTGPKTDVVPSRPENGCRTIRAKVLRQHRLNSLAFFVEVEGQEVLVIDIFGLNPGPGEFVYFHQRVICEVEDPLDAFLTMGMTGGEFQSNPVEPPDSEELGGRIPMPEVIRPLELPTEPLVTAPQPQPTGRRSLVDEEDPGDVKIGVPATVLPQTTQAQCECGHECKGGHPCPRAPLMIQTGSPEPEGVEEVMYGNHFDGNPS